MLAAAAVVATARSIDQTHEPVVHVTGVQLGLVAHTDGETQAPARHMPPAAQALPQRPQLVADV